MRIRVCSWNISADGSRDYKGIASFVRQNSVDILLLQEAAIYFDIYPATDMTESVAKELQFASVFYPAFDGRPKKAIVVGNGIVSRFPISSANPTELSPDLQYSGTHETEQRIAVSARVLLPGNKIFTVVNTHLQFSKEFQPTEIRLDQIENLIGVIGGIAPPFLLAGNFNALAKNPEITLLEKLMTRIGGDEPTWPSKTFEYQGWVVNPLMYRPDHIFLSRDCRQDKFQIGKSDLFEHLPLIVDLSV